MHGMGYARGPYQMPQPQRNNRRRFRGSGHPGGNRFEGRPPMRQQQQQQQRPKDNRPMNKIEQPANATQPAKPQDKVDAPAPVQQPAQAAVKANVQPAANKPAQPAANKPAQPAVKPAAPPANKPQQQPQTQQQQTPQQQQQQNKQTTPNQNANNQNQQQKNVPDKPKNAPSNNANANTGFNANKQQNDSNVKPYQNQNQQNQNQNQNQNHNHNQNQFNNNMNSNRGYQGGPGMRNRRHGPPDRGGPAGARDEYFIMSKLKDLSGPTLDLQPAEQGELKFCGRNRLYVGNLTNDITEDELLEMFSAYGETSELFLNKEKNFAFIRIDYKVNAEKAKRELDGRMRRGRSLRVRFAPHNAAIKIKNIAPFVTNELLYRAFEVFGKVERAIVKVDERGKSIGEGLVEYSRKTGAIAAIKYCSERCYFLTSSLRPVVVESYEEADEGDGYAEKSIPKKNQDYHKAREVGPRLAEPGSFEHEYGTKWKQLYELFKQKEESLKREMNMEEEKLEAQMEYAKYEHETELLREQLRQREHDRERQKRTWQMTEKQVDEQREKEMENFKMQTGDIQQRMRHQEDELRRRQKENTLFMQAQQLNRILDEQEQGMSGRFDPSMQDMKRGYDGPMSGMGNMSGMGGNMQMMCGGHMGYDDGMGRWDNRQEDYPNKRRRY